ncbi:MAG: hypothetical protein IEMM0008_0535 [bacterium]|nr:MAG: hypothetical protein IEMM0008_0535 [bacterium]
MSVHEKGLVNQRLAEIALVFGLKFKLTINNAQKVIEENYQKIRSIDCRIQGRVSSMKALLS